ncbi:Retron-type reverse transcriptase [Vibrio angustum S14]|uniref:Retron-type reverse transcriptase n=1 Tax=Photobacterium angustum (strain S14 / CCUG 15956) TaxID=314292 RepID=Q1ZMD0_PHOAS|nr:Retron-type reverse transcriptase [Vibrio angustum S14] [Photobacterium angustum S14]
MKSASKSEQKKTCLLEAGRICHTLASEILTCQYQPEPYHHFAITEPKLREIYAPAFKDRIVQMWIVSQLEKAISHLMIDDTYATQLNKGTFAAINKAQKLMRKPHYRVAMQLDIYSYFNHINKARLKDRLVALIETPPQSIGQFHPVKKHILLYLIEQILQQDAARENNLQTNNHRLLAQIPPHKRLSFSQQGVGLPIGSVTSQMFGNFYLNDLDHFCKHTLKIKGYIRFMDDLIVLSDNIAQLKIWKNHIDAFLKQQLLLTLHPHKTKIKVIEHGVDYLGYTVYPHYKTIRPSTLHTFKARLRYFNALLEPDLFPNTAPPDRGVWQRWHKQGLTPALSPTLLKAMQSTINSYFGLLSHGSHCRLRKSLYHDHFHYLKRYMMPKDHRYSAIKIKKNLPF